jgi:hypothetical protein
MEQESNFSDKFREAVKESFSFIDACLFPKEASGRGYGDGIKDAMDGVPKDTRTRVSFEYGLSPNSKRDLFWKSYHEGYHKGYDAGLAKRNGAYDAMPAAKTSETDSPAPPQNFSSKIHHSSMNKASLEYQLEVTQQLIKTLHRLNENLDKAQNSYAKRIDQLENAGLMSNAITVLREDKHAELQSKIASLSERIRENDIKYLDALQGEISDSITDLSK